MATFDLVLFEELNEAYRDRRLVPKPPVYSGDGRMEGSRRRLTRICSDVSVEGKRVLEVGPAHGHLCHLLASEAGAREVVGVDTVRSKQWAEFERDSVRFFEADLASERVLEPESVDVIISNSVLEHVERPLGMLSALACLLVPGGEAWLNFNLHRGPKASHRYREVFFPWPHLIFESEIAKQFYLKHHGRPSTFAWVNKMTAAEYLQATAEVGLQIDDYRRSITEIDVEFYSRFEEKLGAYPALDLETDFLWLKLVKSSNGDARPLPLLGYTERQDRLHEELEQASVD